MARTCPECGSKMEQINEKGPAVWVCPACKLLQFQEESGNIQTRYPHPVRVTGEEEHEEEPAEDDYDDPAPEDIIIGTTIPHSDFGDPECCGCLCGVIDGDIARVVCNECRTIVKTVPAKDLQRTLDEMELKLDVTSAKCPHCGVVHLAPGLSKLIAFVCGNCGKSVSVETPEV